MNSPQKLAEPSHGRHINFVAPPGLERPFEVVARLGV
jgi:hypothetical protein